MKIKNKILWTISSIFIFVSVSHAATYNSRGESWKRKCKKTDSLYYCCKDYYDKCVKAKLNKKDCKKSYKACKVIKIDKGKY